MREAGPGDLELKVCYRCIVRLDTSLGGADLPRRLRQALAAHGEGRVVALAADPFREERYSE